MAKLYFVGRPSSNWGANYERASIPFVVDVDLEDLVIPSYCGPKSMCPYVSIVAYMPFCNLFTGSFVLVWPSDLTIYPI
jgi:hypothetical protein